MTPLVSGPIFQICWVVADITAAEEEFSENWGVQRWLRMPDLHFGPETTTYRGQPADYTAHISLGYAGTQQIELIQPVSGRSLYSEFLDTHGVGVHHVAFVPDDYDETLAEVERRGMSVLQQGRIEDVGMEFAYVDAGPTGGYVELMKLSPEIRLMFDSLITY
ncbi:lactoylglutathione lyase [Rhodococcus sp. ACPA4]|uniref:VOC family protein n=1 Tax=Rhodococcus TaxID=1827 RepID=UPI0005D369CD|nr:MULTISPECIES: VOC family protein [unclassified Rhodococcus (in: high G+C Gram-positive bacteria)]KJF20722.1 methylmalonyl-CoA epimerase [Rhodococcus sp. AD45]NRI65597.1 VOC family protein [Rhodococcus sp. MS16]PBC37219.1 lactoylglutathione lyase [Rhodococcus sp. ACPA4]PSR38313.1 lactoylglutathione lyase [Rhodococcus sp. AD45-ID]ROZ44487.1 VOC family protein [Rhodococcus sp. WS3]